MTRRRSRTVLQRAAIFDAHNGICHICGCKIDGTREAWELEHIVAYALTRDDSDENLAPAHVKCHRTKTDTDVKAIAKSKRIAAKHNGAKKRSTFQGSRDHHLKKKIDGTVVPR